MSKSETVLVFSPYFLIYGPVKCIYEVNIPGNFFSFFGVMYYDVDLSQLDNRPWFNVTPLVCTLCTGHALPAGQCSLLCINTHTHTLAYMHVHM